MAAGKRCSAEFQALIQRMRDGGRICDFNNFSHVLILTKIEKKYCLRLVHVFSELVRFCEQFISKSLRVIVAT